MIRSGVAEGMAHAFSDAQAWWLPICTADPTLRVKTLIIEGHRAGVLWTAELTR